MSSLASCAWTSENVMTKSGLSATISSSRPLLKPLTIGLASAPCGSLKKVVMPTTFSQAPMRHNQSTDSADKQTMRSSARLILGFCILENVDADQPKMIGGGEQPFVVRIDLLEGVFGRTHEVDRVGGAEVYGFREVCI